jgi:hypothetical protein
MDSDYKRLTDFLVGLGTEQIGHSSKTYLGHLVNVYRLLKGQGYSEDVCRAGMFHSIYGTQVFQGFTLPLERRPEVGELIGERAERLAYLNCFVDRDSLDRAAEEDGETYGIRERDSSEDVRLSRADFDDLCRVHLFDWLEQVPRSRWGWNYRRGAYRRMAERLGPEAVETYDRVFALEKAAPAAP